MLFHSRTEHLWGSLPQECWLAVLSYPPKYHGSALHSDDIGAPTSSKLLLMLLPPQLVFRCAFITRAVAALAIKPPSYARVHLYAAVTRSSRLLSSFIFIFIYLAIYLRLYDTEILEIAKHHCCQVPRK